MTWLCVVSLLLLPPPPQVLVWTDLDLPRALAVHPSRPLLYWTDWGNVPKIERSGVDGSDRRAVVTTGLTWPNSIVLDTDTLYWLDGKEHVIEVSLGMLQYNLFSVILYCSYCSGPQGP